MFASTSYQLDTHVQTDGRRYVDETFVETDGTKHIRSYLASVGADYDATLGAHAAQLWAELQAIEYAEVTA